MSVERLWRRAQSYLAQGQSGPARITLDSLLAREPGFAPAHLLLGGIAYAEDRYRDTARHALAAAQSLPDDAEMVCRVALTLLQVGEVVVARRCLDHLAISRCASGPLLAQLSSARQMIGDHAQALELLDRAKTIGHDSADFRYIRGVQLTFNGRLQEAEAELNACLRLGSRYGRACVTLARLRRQTAQSNHLDLIRTQLARVAHGSEDHAALEYAQYKELEDLGDHAAAWAALQRGAALMFALHSYDSAGEDARIERLIQLCTPDFLQRESAVQPGPQPIFIVGMPRSGTTLLDRMLGNHSAIVSAGELGDFARALRWATDHSTLLPQDEIILDRAAGLDFAEVGRRYLAQTQWRADGKPYFVDKLPINWMQVGFIRRALPQARILHMQRDPLDVCFSNYRAFFGVGYAYSYDLDALVAHYRNYRRVMQHWHRTMPDRVLDVSYEALTENPEAVARQVLDYCGLPFEADCIDLQSNRSPVATLSSMQVRDAIHRRGVGEWRRYEKQLEPLRTALAG